MACWSMADGEAFGNWRTMHDKSDGHNGRHWDKDGKRSWPVKAEEDVESPAPDWQIFRRMPSARLFVLSKGDVLVIPCSTYHYVYTVERKIVVAGDFLDGSCWERRKYSVERDKEVRSDEKTTDLDMIRRRRQGSEQRCASRASNGSAV
uniref:JmjC domain-containing protein n=1 Tax=Haptolina brevifila TaxID=156173 RepID=A0A7S2FYQ3_9EUKA